MAKRMYSFEWDGAAVECERPKFGQFEKLVELQMRLDALEQARDFGKEWSTTLRQIFACANIPEDMLEGLYDLDIGDFYVAMTNGLWPSAGGDEGNPKGGGSNPTSAA